jgi:hypothetical protein
MDVTNIDLSEAPTDVLVAAALEAQAAASRFAELSERAAGRAHDDLRANACGLVGGVLLVFAQTANQIVDDRLGEAFERDSASGVLDLDGEIARLLEGEGE